MDLADGLKEYQKDSAYWVMTTGLEEAGRRIREMLGQYGQNPSKECLAKAKEFLVETERWKAMCIEGQTGMASTNPEASIWAALAGASAAKSDEEALMSIMNLAGFGRTPDKQYGLRRAKRATAVLRFLKPEDWGVVDWRTLAILGLLDRCNGDVETVLVEARAQVPKELRGLYDIVDEKAACQTNNKYRTMRNEQLPRAADVDMALFGISLRAWPIKPVSSH